MPVSNEQVNAFRKIALEEPKNCEELKNLTDQEWEALANGVAGYYLSLFDIYKTDKK